MPNGFLIDFDAWGTPFWQVGHAMTFMYPLRDPTEADKTRMINFFTMYPFILPCGSCGRHFQEYTKPGGEFAFTSDLLEGQERLSRWLVALHNAVNRRLGKPEALYDDVKRFYVEDCGLPCRPGDAGCAGEGVGPFEVATIVLSVVLALAIAASVTLLVLMKRRAASSMQP